MAPTYILIGGAPVSLLASLILGALIQDAAHWVSTLHPALPPQPKSFSVRYIQEQEVASSPLPPLIGQDEPNVTVLFLIWFCKSGIRGISRLAVPLGCLVAERSKPLSENTAANSIHQTRLLSYTCSTCRCTITPHLQLEETEGRCPPFMSS